jgi:hypothetical protein
MLIKENYEVLSKNIFDCKMRCNNDSDLALENTIAAAILCYIESNPKNTIEQTKYRVGRILDSNEKSLSYRLKIAYPRANPEIQKRIDINKLFTQPIKTNYLNPIVLSERVQNS